MGLLRLFKRQGLRVQPFKCGPDYIDTQFHAIAAGQPSVNLDPWMQGAEEMRRIYDRYAREADICVVEGAMGLFDGYDRDTGSAAEVARLLDLPVVLVVAARSVAFSVAPLLYGFRHFDERLRIEGVIFNEVGSAKHEAMLRQAAEAAGVRCLGCVPRVASLQMPSRHLGLTLTEQERMNEMADRVADVLESLPSLPTGSAGKEPVVGASPRWQATLHSYIARDACFSFCYQTTIDALAALGEVSFFSPLANEPVPDEASFIYLPGGYPELFAEQLAVSTVTMASLRLHAERGTQMIAECGGMMYLGRSIETDEPRSYPMCGLLPLDTTMQGARLQLGYRQCSLDGIALRGHEFHYSRLSTCDLPSIAQQSRPTGEPTDTLLMRQGSILAGYTHWFWTTTALKQLTVSFADFCHDSVI